MCYMLILHIRNFRSIDVYPIILQHMGAGLLQTGFSMEHAVPMTSLTQHLPNIGINQHFDLVMG